MDGEESVEIAFAENGDPILDQLCEEEGFVDCTFRILNLVSNEHEHSFHLSAYYKGESVGFNVVVVKGIRGAFDAEMNLISDHVYRGGVSFLRSGLESDRLMRILAALYAFPSKEYQMVDSFSFTGIALHYDDVDMESDAIKIKLFGNDAEDMSEDDYFESFFNLDLSSGMAFWNEKDPDYRVPLMRGLSFVESGSS